MFSIKKEVAYVGLRTMGLEEEQPWLRDSRVRWGWQQDASSGRWRRGQWGSDSGERPTHMVLL